MRGHFGRHTPRRGGTERKDGPIVLVSNRLPITVQRGVDGLELRRSTGGLVSALEPILERCGGTWVGWAGSTLRADDILLSQGRAYKLRAVPLTEAEVAGYYHGFANGTLWPLFHCFPARTHFDRRGWKIYEEVNRKFATVAVDAADGGNQLLWVHDYHLMLVPFLIRQAAPAARVAFFLHIPFPPYDVFRLLPWDRELLRGILACDLIGFHVLSYAQNFLDCVARLLAARVDREAFLIEHGDRTIKVGAFPIGIDFDLFESLADAAPPSNTQPNQRIVLGVDRLDYTKGIPERILAFERLLELYPQHREKVALVQLAVPSRFQVAEYRHLKRQVDELVGRVNGRFGTAHWTPIRYLYRSLPRERLAELYRNAHVALVSPLRDGMNLVAKEFVACQVSSPGVLVLSRLAGAAETMREAILVNPYNLDAMAEAIHRALTMQEPERRSRMVALRQRERESNVFVWARNFLDAARAGPVALHPPTDADFESWLGTLLRGRRVALFLDYDGTLVALCERSSDATLSPQTRRLLQACARRPDTDVAIVSGRAMEDLRALVPIRSLTLVANHGLEIVGPELKPFRHPDIPHYLGRLTTLAAELNNVAPPGAVVENKGATLTFHYRNVEPTRQAEIAEEARRIITRAGFMARNAHKAVEARPPIGWDKGQAVLHVVRSRYGPLWSEQVRVVYVGDDETDEDAFRILAGLGVGFRVGSAEAPTYAARRLPGVAAVTSLLRWLARRPLAVERIRKSAGSVKKQGGQLASSHRTAALA